MAGSRARGRSNPTGRTTTILMAGRRSDDQGEIDEPSGRYTSKDARNCGTPLRYKRSTL